MSANAIQFYGLETVVEAFEKRNCNAWSLWAGKQFLLSNVSDTAAEAVDKLEEFLEMVERNGNNCCYTLMVYEDYAGKITSKTACDGSFNFKFSKGEYPSEKNRGVAGIDSSLERRLSGIENLLMKRAEPEEKLSTIGQVGDYIENNPWAQNILMGLASQYLKIPGLQSMYPTPGQAAHNLAGIPEENDKKINDAIAILKGKDPKLGEHLMKLASMPDQNLAFLLNTLDQM